MAHHPPADVDPEELKRAQEMWDGFTKLIKWSIISTAAILVLLVLIFFVFT